MNKTLIFIVLLMTAVLGTAYADPFQLTMGAELGYRPFDREWGIHKGREINSDQPVQVTKFDVEALVFDHFFVGGSMACHAIAPWDRDTNNKSFKPITLDSQIWVGAQFGSVTVTYLHMCGHPVESQTYARPNRRNEAYEEVSVRFEKTF